MFRETRNCSDVPLTPAEERYSDIISLADIFADQANSLTDPDPSAEESVSECLAVPQESVSDSLCLADEIVSEPIHVAEDSVFEAVRVEGSEADLVTDGEDADGGEGAEDDSTILRKVRHIQFTATVDLTVSGVDCLRAFFRWTRVFAATLLLGPKCSALLVTQRFYDQGNTHISIFLTIFKQVYFVYVKVDVVFNKNQNQKNFSVPGKCTSRMRIRITI